MPETRQPIHDDSSLLWSLLQQYPVEPSFKAILDRLDAQQKSGEISPHLAETLRDVIFLYSQESRERFNDLTHKVVGSPDPLKAFFGALEEGGMPRLKKS